MRERTFGFILSLFIFVCYCNSMNNCEEDGKSRQTFVIRYKDGEQTIPVTVVLDYRKQTEYVINMNPRSPAKSVTLYDFKQRTIAYKDLTNRECFLGRLTNETLSEESHALQDVKNPVEVRPKIRSLDPRTPALTPTEIRNLAGQKTAVFCRKMNTWLLMPEKAHRISKREAEDEFEERTLEYHGHRSHQYSHFQRETRRRIRNRNQSNHKRRSRTREGAAVHKNGDSISEQNFSPRHFQKQNGNDSYINPGHFESLHDISNQNQSRVNEVPHNSYSSIERNSDEEKENINNEVYFPKRESFGRSKTKLRDSNNSGAKISGIHSHQSNDTNEGENLEYELLSKDALKNNEKSNPSARFAVQDTESRSEVVATTTETPTVSIDHQGLSHPNVHSSLVHLLPVYKPVSREFDLNQNTRSENRPTNQLFNENSNLEREVYPPLPTHDVPENKLARHDDLNDTSPEHDVSVNVLQIPRAAKEFENFQNNESHVSASQPKHNRRFHNSHDNYPTLPRIYSESLPDIHYNNLNKVSSIHSGHVPLSTNINHKNVAKEISVNGDNNNPPQTDISTTTEQPVLTTQRYPFRARTTPYSSYIPSVHTAFQNSEDFNSFLIFPNDFESRNFHSPTEASAKALEDNRSEIKSRFKDRTPQDLLLTTKNPLLEDRRSIDTNHRSDIPSENDFGNGPSNNHFQGNQQKSAPFSNIINDTSDDPPPHKTRYQNALFGFKPDEIVIDIGNIATHNPTPVTATFDQRTTTTIQPTIRSVPTENRRIISNRRNEQVGGPSWRSLIPSTRYPRRRINGKPQRPVHSGTIPVPQRVPFNQNHYNLRPSPQINQLYGVNQFPAIHRTNRRQFHYPSRPIPPPHIQMPIDMNQFHHNSHLVNLPPGVSIHPRHPQAPFADMVHSNRPPTMPILENGEEYLKPHRQRHHRKKDRHLNSCCRLRGNAAAFQSCCRNGGPCCASARRRLHPQNSSCCSPPRSNDRILPPVRTANKVLPPVRITESHRSEVDNRDRCQKEKMCRTLYESTQQVMVCRNAHVDGC